MDDKFIMFELYFSLMTYMNDLYIYLSSSVIS